MSKPSSRHPACQFVSDKPWLDPQYQKDGSIKKPEDVEKEMENPPNDIDCKFIVDHIHGSMIGMALGDALGAFVEFRPHDYMVANPVTTLKGGGTWGLKKGQFTDDTSMALCLANSLVARRAYVPYDQLVRYKWWHQHGYMSSTGSCFDIGSATRQSLLEFVRRQEKFAKKYNIPLEELDFLSDSDLLNQFDVNCSKDGVAGNGALMRLAPVPLFFHQNLADAIEYSGLSGQITHGDDKAIDACRYYGALIVAAVNGASKDALLNENFYEKNKIYFGNKSLHPDIMKIARGSFKRREGHADGIRGKGYIVNALEAALWAFWSDEGSFEKGALAAVNLGDDTDTTAAIYGQLAGAYYGFKNLPKQWTEQVYAKDFIKCLSKWIAYEGKKWSSKTQTTLPVPTVIVESPSKHGGASPFENEVNSNPQPRPTGNEKYGPKSSETNLTPQREPASISKQFGDPTSNNLLRRHTSHDSTYPVQPSLHEQHASNRPSSAERKNPPESSQRLYFHKTIKSVEQVYREILSLGDDYVPYAKKFNENRIDGYWFLNQVDDERLVNLGVENSNHRQVLRLHIEKLKNECPKQYTVDDK